MASTIPWVADDLLDVPKDAAPPRYMTASHPNAVGTYGPQFVEWANARPHLHPRKTSGLRWWQTLAAYRLLEHDRKGRLLWRNVLVTVSRQVGKSWLIRAINMWRMEHGPDLFGEPQILVSTAHKLGTATEIWRPAHRWAYAQPGWRAVQGNNERSIEDLSTGSRWIVQAATDGLGVGFSLSVIQVDEAWQVQREVAEAADPALSESESPQLWLVSTAGDSSSDLFGSYREGALDTLDDPTNTLLLEWSAEPGSLDDHAEWRRSQPIWSERRYNEMLDKRGKATSVEFEQQYLNRWIDGLVKEQKEPGEPIFTADDFQTATMTQPTVAAVEAWWEDGCSLALAERLPDGSCVVSIQEHPDIASAARTATSTGASVVLAGKSISNDPALKGCEARGGTSKAAITELRRLIDEGAVYFDSPSQLQRQALDIRVVPSSDGPRLRSQTRLDGIKAAVWAVEYVRGQWEPPAVF